MPTDTTEKGFETAIESHLLAHGYERGAGFDAALALDAATLVRFLQATQTKEWDRLAALYGSEAEARIVGVVAKNLDARGTLECLRHGVTDRGVRLRMAFFRPNTRMNPETLGLYNQNILTITRQVHYATKNPSLSIDTLIALNGIPVATAELKNPFTGQRVGHAIHQYKEDRDPTEPLLRFKQRALVHFAVDPDEVFMTTRLSGKGTTFLPFNKGRDGGKGNPDNPDGFKTAYLWEEVLQRDSWLDILARFVQFTVSEETSPAGKKVRKEAIIFPRYHQLDAVRRLLGAASSEGPGHNYLIQHSAGSGKSNSIAWLAHQLSGLHDDDDKKVFDAVIVITDRRVLDKQLQDNIYQFEHKQGVVQKVDEGSKQLAEALRSGTQIIITTLQKFPFVKVVDELQKLGDRRYALIVDEAHSSQSGESATKLRQVLTAGSLEEAEAADAEAQEPDVEDEIAQTVRARGPQESLSYFAFTATPKHKTLELFGRDGPDGKPLPYHLYSMRQAIEEKFILDVLANYTTYATYYRLSKAVEDDPELDRRKATQAIARFVSLHPHNLAQKAEVMVEHFRQFTRKQIGGKAKAMVVTRSRKHAVRYMQAFKAYLKEKGYSDIGVLVAFSGSVDDGGIQYTEPQMNADAKGVPLTEKRLPEAFADDSYHVLIVAEKYQTGFDQPLLHTMFVDKKLEGLHAVQTLSRLNRTAPGKEDTFVLDFVNTAEEIQAAFKPYYEATEIEERVDPQSLYLLKAKLDAFQVYWQQEVEDFAQVFFRPAALQRESDKGKLHAIIDPAVGRWSAETEERRHEFRHQIGTFLRLYSFASQVVAFGDPGLEKLYAYGRLLITKLRDDAEGGGFRLDDEVQLAFYRLTKTGEGSVSLQPGDKATVSGPTEVGTGNPPEEDKAKLSEIVDVLNERFGTDFTSRDQLVFEATAGDLAADERIADQARTNSIENFRLEFDAKALAALVSRLDRDEDVVNKVLSNEQLRDMVITLMAQKVYDAARSEKPAGAPSERS